MVSKPKSDVIKDLVEELGRDGLGDDTINELVLELRREYPQNEAVSMLSKALDVDVKQEPDESELPWIVFSINKTAYGINSKYVLSIEILGELIPIVDAPHYCPGIVRSRGDLIELLDIRALFGSGDYQSAITDSPTAVFMMIVTEMNQVKRGLIVDEILAVEHITQFEEGITSSNEGAITSHYVKQIAKREKSDSPVLILKPDSLIAP